MASNIETEVTMSSSSRGIGSPIPDNCEIVEVSEIRDLLEYNPPQAYNTSAVLNYCQRKMILPYTRLLGLLGLRPLLRDFSDQSIIFSAINKMHLFLVTCFLLFGYAMQLVTCYRRDQGFSYAKQPSHKHMAHNSNHMSNYSSHNNIVQCEGTLSICYILPSLLHLCAFIHTIYLLRMTENEHLQTLFEKVFLLTSRSRGALTQRVLLRRLRGHQPLLNSSLSYLLYQVVGNTLIGVMIASTFCQDVVHCLVVSNYCIECQLLMSNVVSISERVLEKSLVLEVAMKELLEYEKFLSYLNQQVSPATFIFFILSTTRAVVTALTVIKPGFLYYNIDAHSFIVIMLLVQWTTISIAPLISAAYLTSANRTVRQVGQKIRVRPFGFQETSPQSLDSFMIFTASHKGAAKLCFFPISSAWLGAVFTVTVIIFLVKSHTP